MVMGLMNLQKKLSVLTCDWDNPVMDPLGGGVEGG